MSLSVLQEVYQGLLQHHPHCQVVVSLMGPQPPLSHIAMSKETCPISMTLNPMNIALVAWPSSAAGQPTLIIKCEQVEYPVCHFIQEWFSATSQGPWANNCQLLLMWRMCLHFLNFEKERYVISIQESKKRKCGWQMGHSLQSIASRNTLQQSLNSKQYETRPLQKDVLTVYYVWFICSLFVPKIQSVEEKPHPRQHPILLLQQDIPIPTDLYVDWSLSDELS